MALNESMSTKNEPQAKRMAYFLKLIDKALLEAGKSIDPRQAVIECYGEDASMFAGDAKSDDNDDDSKAIGSAGNKLAEEKGREVLAELVKETICRVNESIKEGILEVLEREDVNGKMLKLERIIDEYNHHEKQTKKKEEDDKALRDGMKEKVVKLPNGMTPADLVNYHAYKLRIEERDKLLAEIASIEAENEAIERQIEKGRGAVKRRLEEISEISDDVSGAASANACVFSGIS